MTPHDDMNKKQAVIRFEVKLALSLKGGYRVLPSSDEPGEDAEFECDVEVDSDIQNKKWAQVLEGLMTEIVDADFIGRSGEYLADFVDKEGV